MIVSIVILDSKTFSIITIESIKIENLQIYKGLGFTVLLMFTIIIIKRCVPSGFPNGTHLFRLPFVFRIDLELIYIDFIGLFKYLF